MKRRRLADLSARDIDEMRERHDSVELDRYLAEQMEREPREDPDFKAWLTHVEDEDAAA